MQTARVGVELEISVSFGQINHSTAGLTLRGVRFMDPMSFQLQEALNEQDVN